MGPSNSSQTRAPMMARPAILDAVRHHGWLVFERGDHNANLIVERNSWRTDVADDVLHLVYRVDGEWVAYQWPCISVPHPHYIADPVHPRGAAVLAAGQHRGSHRLGIHPYPGAPTARPALVATRHLPVHRLPDLGRLPSGTDLRLHLGELHDDGSGINVHDGRLLAGCIGLPDRACMRALLMALAPCWSVSDTVSLTVIDPE